VPSVDSSRARYAPTLDFAVAAMVVVVAIVAGVSMRSTTGWLLATALLAVAGYLVAVGLRVRRHPERLAAGDRARRRHVSASMREHPLRWLIGMPIFGAVDGALHMSGFRHTGAGAIALSAGIGAVAGLGVAGYATWRATRSPD
jgi:hypothetical protein